jgi:hypothetical protein
MPMHATGDQGLWDLHSMSAPSRTVNFNELPTDVPIVVKNQQRLAKIGNEIVKVANHPEDILPHMLEQFQAMALQQRQETGAKPKKQAEQQESNSRKLETTPRRSSRQRKQTDFYQAGLNSMQASSAPRGYVDSSSRYRSYSRERIPRDQSGQRHTSQQGRDSRQPSRDTSRSRYYQRTPSRDQSQTRYRTPSGDRNRQRSTYRPQSRSPYRTKSPGYTSENRQSRTPYRTDYQSRDRSRSTRNTYHLMKKGVNCKPSYDPNKMKYCTKCMKNDHHEFECARYYRYNENKCSFCHKMYHLSQECKEVKEFPPGVTTKN